MEYPTRLKVAAFLMLAMALVVSVRALSAGREVVRQGGASFGAAPFEERYEALKALLPVDATVGYVTDAPREDTRGYYMTRYVLAPVRVAWEGDAALAVGDFRDARNIAGILRARGYVVEKDLGRNVLLLRRGAN